MALPIEQAIEKTFDESLEQELLKYPGKWTGIVADLVVAVGDTPADVLRIAQKAGHTDVLLHHVPEHGKAYFF